MERLVTMLMVALLWSLSLSSCFAKGTLVTEGQFRDSLFIVKKYDVGAQYGGNVELGDRVVAINGQPVSDQDSLQKAVKAGGKSIKLTLQRGADSGQQDVDVDVTLGKEGKLGFGFSKVKEYILHADNAGDVLIASSARSIEGQALSYAPTEQEQSSGNLTRVKVGTKVLALPTLRKQSKTLQIFILDGPRQGELWFTNSQSVKPQSFDPVTRVFQTAGIAIALFILIALWRLIPKISGLFGGGASASKRKELPTFVMDEVSRAFADKCTKINKRQKDSAKQITIKANYIEYRGYKLKWVISRGLLIIAGDHGDDADVLLAKGIKEGQIVMTPEFGKAIFVGLWPGHMSDESGKEEVLWEGTTPTTEIVSLVLDGLFGHIDNIIEGRSTSRIDEVDADEFETWLEDPDWFPVTELPAETKSGQDAAINAIVQLCSNRDAAVSEHGILISLAKNESMSEATQVGEGTIAIVWQGYPELVQQLLDKLKPLGYQVVYNDLNKDKLFIHKSKDQYACLNLQGHIAYKDAKNVARKLKEWDSSYNLSLRVSGFGSDWVDAEINPPEDTSQLAKDILSFCPDILEHESEPHKVLTEELRDSRRIHLWWD